jgi:hypothetical protein
MSKDVRLKMQMMSPTIYLKTGDRKTLKRTHWPLETAKPSETDEK